MKVVIKPKKGTLGFDPQPNVCITSRKMPGSTSQSLEITKT